MNHPFNIDTRYYVTPALNQLSDTVLGKESRLEPRLMKLLCFLAENNGQLVTRDFLIKEIWNDYGGADEGLNHAVSQLRKLLNDAEKSMIETVPKKGYIMRASIDTPVGKKISSLTPVASPVKTLGMSRNVALTLASLLVLVIGYLVFKAEGQTGAVPVKQQKMSKQAFKELSKPNEETALNTIVTMDEKGNQYKLVVMGESRPSLFINSRLLTPDEMELHLPLIARMKKELLARNEAK